MTVFDQSLDALDRLLAKTSKEEILQIYSEVTNKYKFEGPTINEYFERNIETVCVTVPPELFSIADETLFVPPPSKYKFPENTAPNFSGYFFLCNIAV